MGPRRIDDASEKAHEVHDEFVACGRGVKHEMPKWEEELKRATQACPVDWRSEGECGTGIPKKIV